jgi:hypothetical protein
MDTKMTDSQVDHARALSKEASKRVFAKYEKGALEHGTNLWEKGALELTDLAIEEAVDQLTYLLTLREKLTGTPRTLAEILGE